jgi:hypothetical protein
MQYTITTASSSITSSRRRSWQKQRIAVNARSANFQPLHAPSVHAGSEHVLVIHAWYMYPTCIQHVSNKYQSYHTCITCMYHTCISAYQGGFGHRVSRMYQCVSEARPKSVCIMRVSARITCIRNGVYLDTCIMHVSACICVYHTLCITHMYQVCCIRCIRCVSLCIVNLYHNSCKQQKMTDI